MEEPFMTIHAPPVTNGDIIAYLAGEIAAKRLRIESIDLTNGPVFAPVFSLRERFLAAVSAILLVIMMGVMVLLPVAVLALASVALWRMW